MSSNSDNRYSSPGGIENSKRRGHVEDSIGHMFPWIRIGDYELHRDEIKKVEISSGDFLPTIYIKVYSSNTMFEHMVQNTQREIISFYVRQDIRTYKPIQCDFMVTSIYPEKSELNQFDNSDDQKAGSLFVYDIYGEMYVPNIYSSSIQTHFNGTPDNALRNISSIIGLGFTKSVNTETNKSNIECINYQPWDCYTNPDDYINFVIGRMWRNTKSFFQGWIDFYYNLTVVNVGETMDADADVLRATWSKFQTIISTYEEDGAYFSNDFSDISKTAIPKLLTNWDLFRTSSLYVMSYKMVNQSYYLTEKYGIFNKVKVYLNNRGINSDNIDDHISDIDVGVYYNQDKLQSGDYTVSIGDSHLSLDDNRNVLKKNIKVEHSEDAVLPYTPVMSTEDVSNFDNRSGNIDKMTDIAYYHNKINNEELEKQYIEVELKGINLSISRGERIPMWIFEKGDTKYLKNIAIDKSFEVKRPYCGEFYVNSISYTYEPSAENGIISSWNTVITLTRKEWLTPEPGLSRKEIDKIENKSTVGNIITDSKNKDTSISAHNKVVDTSYVDMNSWEDPLPDNAWEEWSSVRNEDIVCSSLNNILSDADSISSSAEKMSGNLNGLITDLNSILKL